MTASICATGDEGVVCAGEGAGEETRRQLAQVATRSQKVHVLADVISAADDQVGPARIISFSGGTDVRNLTLGQRGTDLVLRIRSPLAGSNSSRGEFVLEDAIQENRPTRLRAYYDAGLVRMSAEAKGWQRRGAYYPGLLQGWLLAAQAFTTVDHSGFLAPAPRWAGKQFREDLHLRSGRFFIALAAALVIFPISWGFSWTLARRWRLATAPIGAAAGMGFLCAADLVLGTPTPRHVLMVALPIALLGGLFGVVDARSRGRAIESGCG